MARRYCGKVSRGMGAGESGSTFFAAFEEGERRGGSHHWKGLVVHVIGYSIAGPEVFARKLLTRLLTINSSPPFEAPALFTSRSDHTPHQRVRAQKTTSFNSPPDHCPRQWPDSSPPRYQAHSSAPALTRTYDPHPHLPPTPTMSPTSPTHPLASPVLPRHLSHLHGMDPRRVPKA